MLNTPMKKPRLLEIRRTTSITSSYLAEQAGVSIGQEYAVEIAGFVDPEVATKVINAFNRLTNAHYTIHDIALNIPRL
jgi:hypothetical protein